MAELKLIPPNVWRVDRQYSLSNSDVEIHLSRPAHAEEPGVL